MNEFRISTNVDELDVALIHQFLSQDSYWAKGIALDIVRKAIANSLCFGGFHGTAQVAFGRVVTDLSTFVREWSDLNSAVNCPSVLQQQIWP